MPMVVNVLESLDLAIIENQHLQAELELSKDENEQLEKQQLQNKIDSLESIVKIFELKSKKFFGPCGQIGRKGNGNENRI
ncbi:JNK-interacting protein 3-like protein [Leptotrombidium deliense]|uniref:JNK-interacting protein 3-like protein n=1 Tax=Leptotrombidium deliense TaxID=299467 RepID=A0A443QV72_9ACAR|nr:JNK-interacting protein 3-like protein [Leptotrombidium deliense]